MTALRELNTEQLYQALVQANRRLSAQKEYLNSLNVFPVPDGDTGTNMAATFNSAVENIQYTNEATIESITRELSRGALLGARGNSGVILSQILRGIAIGLAQADTITVSSLASALTHAKESSYKAVMRPKEGTILSVIRAASESAQKNCNNTELAQFFKIVTEDSYDMLQETRNMLPENKAANTVDAGGAGLMIILNTILDAITGEIDNEEPITFEVNTSKAEFVDIHPSIEDITFQYCTEFIIKAATNEEKFRNILANYGDSIVVVSVDDITKVHIHTDTPGDVLNLAMKTGDLTKIKIDNMKEQAESKVVEEKPLYQAIISISQGDGIENIFKESGANYVMQGGQSMNPSVDDIVKAIENVNAENIIILPNNKNIILSAEQASTLTDKNIFVAKTKSIPQGMIACLSFDDDNSFEENCKTVSEAINDVTSCQLTTAVKDTVLNGINIIKNDILGILEDSIICKGTSYIDTALELCTKAITDECSLVTIIYGKDIEEEHAEELANLIEDKFSEVEVQVLKGGQEVYPLIIGLE